MRDITLSAHALEQPADISRQLLVHDPTLTAKSPSGTPTSSPRAGHEPCRAGRVYLDQAAPAPSEPHSQQPKEVLQQHPQNSPAPRKGRLKLKMHARGFESQSATFWLYALGEVTLPVWASSSSSGKWAQWRHPPAGKCSALGKVWLGTQHRIVLACC